VIYPHPNLVEARRLGQFALLGLDSRVFRSTGLSENEFSHRLIVPTNPVEDLAKAKLMPLHRADDERVCVQTTDFDVKPVAP
jgi:hypothetical protein